MPNIRSQKVTPAGIEIVWSDGTVFRQSKAELLERVARETGTRGEKATKARASAKRAARDSARTSQLNEDWMTLEFSDTTGEPTLLKFVDDA